MRYKLIYSNFNKTTLESKVTIATNIGQFTGYAKCHPDDKISSFAGCNIAEYRAIIKYMKAIKNNIANELKGLKFYKNMIINSPTYNAQSNEARKLRKAIAIKNNQLKELDNSIISLKKTIDEFPQKREEAIKAILDKSKKTED